VSELRDLVRERVRHFRQQREWSARQLSNEVARFGVEMGRSTIANYESGRRDDLTFSEAIALALAFDVRLDELVVKPHDDAVIQLGQVGITASQLSERLRQFASAANEMRELGARIDYFSGQLRAAMQAGEQALADFAQHGIELERQLLEEQEQED
jgi:transcriptional regulator with XRE-family HTH domain